MKTLPRWTAAFLAAVMISALAGCGTGGSAQNGGSTAQNTRTVTDSAGRTVAIPETVERIVCVNVGALRYTCYLGAQDLVVGVEDYEQQERSLTRIYNYVNYDTFASLPVIGGNGDPYPESIIAAGPDVIVAAAFTADDADDLQSRTGIPVVVVPGSDTTLDQKAYDTIRILGEVYGKEDRAEELTAYLDGVKADLETRTAAIPDADKPTVYVGGVSFKGHHGFEGTEAGYGPFALIHANNLADTTGQTCAFDIDTEQVLAWDPDVIFLDFNGMSMVLILYLRAYLFTASEYPYISHIYMSVRNSFIYSLLTFTLLLTTSPVTSCLAPLF